MFDFELIRKIGVQTFEFFQIILTISYRKIHLASGKWAAKVRAM
jgi:hypothetical protein